jgi:hypothetical protein
MIEKQVAVHDGTRALQKAIDGRADRKARAEDTQLSARLSEQQKAVLAEATNIIEALKAEGTAVALTEVFEALRDEMKRAQERLEKGEVGPATQDIEQDIIDALKEMITPFR